MVSAATSPVKKRVPLGYKNVNIRRSNTIASGISKVISPSKLNKNNSFISTLQNTSPLRANIKHTPLVSPYNNNNNSSANFFIFEESEEMRESIIKAHNVEVNTIRGCMDIENDPILDKENNLDYYKNNFKKRLLNDRKPLQDLSIMEFKGYIENPLTKDITELTLQWDNNKNKLPSFITPPRDSKLKTLFNGNFKHKNTFFSTNKNKTTDNININKIVKKLDFEIYEN